MEEKKVMDRLLNARKHDVDTAVLMDMLDSIRKQSLI